MNPDPTGRDSPGQVNPDRSAKGHCLHLAMKIFERALRTAEREGALVSTGLRRGASSQAAGPDLSFCYSGWGGRPCRCRIEIFRHPDRPTVVIASEFHQPPRARWEDASRLVEQVVERYDLDEDTLLFIERRPDPISRHWGGPDETFYRLSWRPNVSLTAMAYDRVQRLIGPP